MLIRKFIGLTAATDPINSRSCLERTQLSPRSGHACFHVLILDRIGGLGELGASRKREFCGLPGSRFRTND